MLSSHLSRSLSVVCAADFGVSALEEMAEQCNFPWLLSNVIDNLDDKPLAKGIISKIIPWQGIKVRAMSTGRWAGFMLDGSRVATGD